MGVNQKILDAIELLTNNSIKKAGYDKTIQAQIISCEDATIGKYKCRYQDTTFFAYAGSADITYSKGAYVYILVPGNDMSKDKTILGTTQKLGINYVSEAVGQQAYDILGKNCVTTSGIYYLATKYKKYSYVIYKYGVSSSPLKLDNDALNQYIKKSSSLIAGMTIRNTIPLQEQYQGHYGITFNLVFNDNSNLQSNGNSKQIIKSYTLDEDNMTGNPYRFEHNTRQYQIFEIDGENFVRIDSIEIFCQDFPNSVSGTLQHYPLRSTDNGVNIFISSVEILGAIRKSDEENNGISISFYTPKGIFFKQATNPSPKEELIVTAQVRIKGKLVSDSQNLSFYWGKENVGIFANSQYYNQHLGRGWKCVNEKNIISPGTATQAPQIEWVPGDSTYIVYREDATARENKLKVAVLYDDTVISKEITIQNLQANAADIIIQSDSGTQFYYDIGHPTLTCKVNGVENTQNYNYYWAWQNNNCGLEALETTTELNNNYTTTYNALQSLKNSIQAGTRFKNEAQQELNNYETTLSNFKYTQRVNKNKIYDLQINAIDGFAIFKCTVEDLNHNYIGTASITLSNSLQAENIYSLIIENGSASYKYNQNGIAPNSKSLDDPQQILALTFKVYDNLGNDITDDIKKRQVTWKIPIENTLLVDENNKTGAVEQEGYRYYSNLDTLVYDIAQKYDVKKLNNQIELFVTYKQINLVAKTNFTFVKQGEPGTNGTQYIVKIIPNSTAKTLPIYPILTAIGDSNSYIVNFAASGTGQQQTAGFNVGKTLFKAQLWQSGDLVWEGTSTAASPKDGVTSPSSVTWNMLKNFYKTNFTDESSFNIVNANTGLISYINTTAQPIDPTFSRTLADILKCTITYNQHSYYSTLPIATAWVKNDNYRIELKDYTGFRYVMYSSDGLSPQYDNSKPFEFIVKEKINNKWEDISLISGSHAVNFSYFVNGDVVNIIQTQQIEIDQTIQQNQFPYINDSHDLELLTQNYYTEDLQKNQCVCRPASRYSGQCVNNALVCTVTSANNNQVIARIHIPIHFLLNKYGLAHINAWDGNSIQLDDKGGYILAPQMGAGKKENDNSFTGVLMGEVKNPDKTTPDIGLLGYNKGDRTFFLNSENGSALFGKANNGQVVIDPSTNHALLYSGNFWKNYNENGLPSNYTSSNEKGQGLLIDLTKPEIRYGSGRFKVDSNGNLVATNTDLSGKITAISGQIGGWTINGTKLIGTESNSLNSQKITLEADRSRIYSGNKTELTSTTDGFHLSPLGLSLGNSFRFKNRYTDDQGILQPATLEMGYLSGNHWTIRGDSGANSSFISFGTKGQNRSVYIGTDEITLGSRFSVDNNGNLTASNVNLSGEINASSGQIGGWSINAFDLKAGNLSLDYEGSISGPSWSISANGDAYFGKIYGDVMSGQSLNGYGFTIGGSGDSWLNPNTIMADDMTGGYYSGSLTDKMIIKCDTLYARHAEIDTLDAKIINVSDNLNANYLTANEIGANYLTASQISANYLNTDELEANYFTYDNERVSWGQIVTDIWLGREEYGDSPGVLYYATGMALGRWYEHSYGSPHRHQVGRVV